MRTDFLILYEHRLREIENSSLLACELERRGYKTKILNISSPSKFFTKPKVLIVPHLYDDTQLNLFATNLFGNNSKIISLQYEQVLTNSAENDPNYIHNPKGEAVYAHHCAWGQRQMEAYKRGNIAEERMHCTGSISMDMYKTHLKSCMLSRAEISKLFNLDINKEWVLFISSFLAAHMSETKIQQVQKLNPSIRNFVNFSSDSFDIIIGWFGRVLEDFPDKIFIYRKHPGEILRPEVAALAERYDNFRIIHYFSIRQWIICCDRFYNWISTSVADLYFVKKPSYVLRPIDVTDEYDISIINAEDKISTLNGFEESLTTDINRSPKPNLKIDYYYGSVDDGYAYLKTADLCEQILNDDKAGYHFRYRTDYSIQDILKRIGYALFYYTCCLFKIKHLKYVFKSKDAYVRRFNNEIYGVKQDVTYYKRIFRPVVNIIHHEC